MTDQHITTQCKLLFSEYGWPETLISENGPCYTAEVFTNLMREYNVNHITSSPHYPQLNGLAERRGKGFVQIRNGIPQYSIIKHFALMYPNLVKEICKIGPSYLKCSQKTTWNRL